MWFGSNTRRGRQGHQGRGPLGPFAQQSNESSLSWVPFFSITLDRHGGHRAASKDVDCIWKGGGTRPDCLRYAKIKRPWQYTLLIYNASPDISSSKTTLLNLVKALGEYLVSDESGIRSKGVYISLIYWNCTERRTGVELLSLVLAKLATDTLNRPAGMMSAPFSQSQH